MSSTEVSHLWNMLKNNRNRIIFLVILGIVTAWLCYLIAAPFIKPFLLAVVFAIIFLPFHTFVQEYVKYKNLAALLSTLLILCLIIVPTIFIGIAVRNEILLLYKSLNSPDSEMSHQFLNVSNKFINWAARLFGMTAPELQNEITSRLQEAATVVLKQFIGIVGNIVTFIVNGVIAFFTLFFLFRDGKNLYRWLTALTPLRPEQVEKLSLEVRKTIRGSMYGGVAVAIAQGVLVGTAFTFLGLHSPMLWGTAAGIFSFVPLIGSAAIWGPAALYLLISGSVGKAIVLIIFGALIVGMVDNIVRPYVISGHVKFHPLYIFFALLGGVQAFGILGLFIGPAVISISQALFTLIREEVQEMRKENESSQVLQETS